MQQTYFKQAAENYLKKEDGRKSKKRKDQIRSILLARDENLPSETAQDAKLVHSVIVDRPPREISQGSPVASSSPHLSTHSVHRSPSKDLKLTPAKSDPSF